VFSLVADNVAENSLVFSAGSSDNPTIKVWNFESRELVYFLETKDSFCQFYMNLIVLPISSKDGGLAQAKGAWKKKIDEISSYRKMRDEKKRKKNNDDTTLVSTSNVFGYIILVATDSCIRTIRLFLQDGIAVEFKEIQVDFKTNCDPGSCILQTLKKNDSEIQVYAGNSIGNVEIFDIKLS
jgi:WD40 repeat protein